MVLRHNAIKIELLENNKVISALSIIGNHCRQQIDFIGHAQLGRSNGWLKMSTCSNDG